jgi:hypothetical protein
MSDREGVKAFGSIFITCLLMPNGILLNGPAYQSHSRCQFDLYLLQSSVSRRSGEDRCVCHVPPKNAFVAIQSPYPLLRSLCGI